MKRRTVLAAAAIAFVTSACSNMGGQSGGGDSGWTTLIDGEKGLENFTRIGGANWRDRKSTRLNSSHIPLSRMPSSA